MSIQKIIKIIKIKDKAFVAVDALYFKDDPDSETQENIKKKYGVETLLRKGDTWFPANRVEDAEFEDIKPKLLKEESDGKL